MHSYLHVQYLEKLHCEKRAHIRSYYGPYFSAFGLRENTDQNNFEYGHFLRSASEPIPTKISKRTKKLRNGQVSIQMILLLTRGPEINLVIGEKFIVFKG